MFQRGDKWYVHVPTKDGGWIQKSTGTTHRRLAQRIHRMVGELRDQRRWDALGLIANGVVTLGGMWDAYAHNALDAFVGEQSSPRWETMVEGWLSTLVVTPATVSAYRRQVAAVLPEGGRVTDLTPGMIRDGMAALTVNSGTKNTYSAAVSSFCHYLVGHELLASHPMNEKSLVPRHSKSQPRMIWMTRPEDEKLCLAAPSPYREYFALVHGTGAERSAALVMEDSDIQLNAGTCHIPGTKWKRNSDRPSTRDRYDIPIDAWALDILRPYVEASRGPLFPTLSKWFVNRGHVAARAVAELDPNYQLRDARHSVAIRWLVQDNVPIWDVAERLGHADQSMAIKVYTRTVLREAARRLGVEITVTSNRG